ncbi:amine dehydrogenase large subunit [Thermus tengchongensis]|uniref:amine dehydrogenase large subunit n=1 Tax=Thermus tengchongensis TaxID=1214928 RepID=UPI000690A5BF|nr:amine dehydrogenase large subunit [Thermus tengchongensis]
MRLLTLTLFLSLFNLALAQLPPETSTTATLPAWQPHWVFVLDSNFPYLTANKATLLDGDRLDMLGMISMGYLANLEVSPDGKEVYAIETFHSRLTRGERTDVVTIYDAKTLLPVGEIPIPAKRFLVVTKRNVTGLTADGRFLLVYNYTPGQSVSVVDLKARRFVGEIETPGCALVYPTGPRQFVMICADGALLGVSLDDNGRVRSQNRSPQIFNPDEDPVFEHAVTLGNRLYLVSYKGKVYEVDGSGIPPRLLRTFALPEEGFRPGGWQLLSAHPNGFLYVLVHQGGDWTHKYPGEEVWVINLREGRRVDRIRLVEPANSIYVTQDGRPLLFALSEHGFVQVYGAFSGRYQGRIDEIGVSPFVLIGR